MSALLISAAMGPVRTRAAEVFQREIEPLFLDRCYACHGERRQESGLRLDLREAALKGGDHGALLVPGRSSDSLLVKVVTGQHPELPRMPKKGEPLSEAEVSRLRAWIDAGAEWPAAAAKARPAEHWAFRAPRRPSVPSGAEHPI
ncbi:MAG: multidrug transporter, partial [Verrucomicrobiales bacterium]|nr:multidrug transporter [Verrucomicrobiales bacterium]